MALGEPSTISATPTASPTIDQEDLHDMPDHGSNGHAAVDPDDAATAPLRERLAALTAQRDELQVQMDEITPQVRRYEKAILALEGKPLGNPQGPRNRDRDDLDSPPQRQGKGRRPPISEARVDEIEAAVRQIASERDDVTQVQVRSVTGHNSSITALAFEVLRQRNVLRLARRQGNLKVYRLTHEAMAQTETTPES
jgi:hypothetical protein